MDWIYFGDRNTKFFHNRALVRQNSERIFALKVGGQWCCDSEALQKEAVRYFSSLYSLDDQTLGRFPLYGCFSALDFTYLDVLGVDVSNEEIRSALFSIGSLKALGLYGIHALFYQIQ